MESRSEILLLVIFGAIFVMRSPRHFTSSLLVVTICCHEVVSTGALRPWTRTRRDHADDQIDAPFNISVVATSCSPPSISVSWQLNNNTFCDPVVAGDRPHAKANYIKSFQISYQLLSAKTRKMFVEVPCSERNVSLDPLLPNQHYVLQVSSLSQSGVRKTSSPVNFVSPSNESYSPHYIAPFPRKTRGKFRHLQSQYPYSHYDSEVELPFIKLDEAVIVVFVLCFWFVVIVVFCNKWGAIRHLEPYHPDFHKRESTDTEVIVDPFSSFSAPHYNPKLQSRMNTLNNVPNSGSVSNFASLETNPGINLGERANYTTRRTSSMSCMNEMHKLETYKRTVSHSASSRFNYHSFAPRLYHCSSTGVYQHKRAHDHRPSLVHQPEFRHPYTQSTSCGIRSCRPSFSVSSSNYSPSRRRSSFQPSSLLPSAGRFSQPTQPRIVSNPTSSSSTAERHRSLSHSLMPLPLSFQLSGQRKIKSAGDLVLELTLASRRERASREQIAESFQ